MIILIAIIALAFAYYFMQRERIRREDRRERMQEKHEELLNILRSRENKEEQEK
jgi:Flp pilus assembly protein TadB